MDKDNRFQEKLQAIAADSFNPFSQMMQTTSGDFTGNTYQSARQRLDTSVRISFPSLTREEQLGLIDQVWFSAMLQKVQEFAPNMPDEDQKLLATKIIETLRQADEGKFDFPPNANMPPPPSVG